MNDSDLSPVERLYRFAIRPVFLVKVICQMLLGLGLAIALIAKIYMFVLTDYRCMADVYSMGNSIRCTDTLAIMAYGLALSAGFELAYRMFNDGIQGAIDPLIVGVSSAFLLVVSSLSLENVNWQVAMLLTSLTLTIGALLYCRERFNLQLQGEVEQHNDTHRVGAERHSSPDHAGSYRHVDR